MLHHALHSIAKISVYGNVIGGIGVWMVMWRASGTCLMCTCARFRHRFATAMVNLPVARLRQTRYTCDALTPKAKLWPMKIRRGAITPQTKRSGTVQFLDRLY